MRGLGSAARWALVGLLVAALAALPALVGALPASDADTSAATLRQQVLDSGDVAFSGYAESAGGLTLPLGETLTSVADLLSDRTTMRTWHRSAEDWRVDVVTATGETGVHRNATGTWTWDYARAEATRSQLQPLALPAEPDLLPTELGRRFLSQARDDELSRIGARRVAGVDALGLRLEPSEEQSSVGRVDLWVDPATGLALQVSVVAAGGDAPALDTRYLDLDLATPAASVTAFRPPPAARVLTGGALPFLDPGRTADRADVPQTLAGLPLSPVAGVPETVGVYGRSVTLLVAVPLPGRFAADVRRQLAAAPGAVVDELGVRLSAGPLGIMVVDGPRGGYLLAGTVTLDALAAAAGELPTTGARA